MSLNILLIDDHTVVRKGLKLFIATKFPDANFFDAEDGPNGIKMLEKHDINLVLSDIHLPGMNGIELIRQITGQYPNMPVIVLSMYQDQSYIKDAIHAGAKAYLTKSMDDEIEIIDAIHSVLKGKMYYGRKTSQTLISGLFDEQERKLTRKEVQIARYLCDGLLYKEIADKMNISTRTVETYRKNILEKLNLVTTADIIKYAIKHGLVSLD